MTTIDNKSDFYLGGRMEYSGQAGANVSVKVSRFRGTDGVTEYHLVVTPDEYGLFEKQLAEVLAGYSEALAELGLGMAGAVARRYFCSDLVNQQAVLASNYLANPDSTETCAVSWVGQPPMGVSKVVLWAYHVEDDRGDLAKIKEGRSVRVQRGRLTHHWTTGLNTGEFESSYEQTEKVFEFYEDYLQKHNMTLTDNVVRTWLFVQNVDANYKGLVEARRELFERCGLRADTHYIASTGIEGNYADPAVKVLMDAYAIEAVRAEQVEYLHVPEYMSPTNVYGVTFERGTALAYRDRKHVLLSGTASIDREGKILHEGDVGKQLERTLENSQAVLRAAGAELEDMAVVLVYLRDICDAELVGTKMRERLGEVPMVIMRAPVCRPGWLVEIEGKAIVGGNHRGMPGF